jgi:hypothetical protein
VKSVFIEHQFSLDYSAQHSSFPSLDALFFRPYLSVSFVFRILCSCGLLDHNTLYGSTTQRVSHWCPSPSNSLLKWIIHFCHSSFITLDFFFLPMPPHVPYGLRGLLSSVTEFWGWGAHEAQLRCPDEVDGDIWIWSTGRGLKPKLIRPWSPWESPPSRKNSRGRTGNRTRDLMISSQKLWPLDQEDGLTLDLADRNF